MKRLRCAGEARKNTDAAIASITINSFESTHPQLIEQIDNKIQERSDLGYYILEIMISINEEYTSPDAFEHYFKLLGYKAKMEAQGPAITPRTYKLTLDWK